MTGDGPVQADSPDSAGQPPYRLDEQLGFLISAVHRRHATLFAERMIEALTPPQFATLAKLREIGPCSQSRLERLVHLDAATLKSVVERLSGRGFIISSGDPSDRRRRAIGLTARGLEVADAAIKVAREISETMLARLAPNERGAVVGLLRKLG